MTLDAEATVAALGMAPHPEGGWYVETWREEAGTAILFLLGADEASHWHRVDATEIWHHHAGAPLDLLVADGDAGPVRTVRLDSAPGPGLRPQGVVPAGAWQAARPVGGAVLVGCTVSPAFSFDRFTIAPPGWQPGG